MVAFAFCIAYWKLTLPNFLVFSDSAKFADVAKNIVEHGIYGTNFSFFANINVNSNLTELFSAMWILPLMPVLISINFIIFGINDFAIIFTSGIFYLGMVLFTYLIAKKLYGNLVAILAGVAVATNLNLLDYATSGASETLLILLFLMAIYFFLLKKRLGNYLGILTLVLLFFSRPHAPIYIVGAWLFYLLVNLKRGRPLLKAMGATVIFIVIFELLLQRLPEQCFIQSILNRGAIASFDYSSLSKGNTALRGQLGIDGLAFLPRIEVLVKKTFYNLYNFYKLLPQIISPYMWALFVIGLFRWGKDRTKDSLKLVTLLITGVTFVAVALTVPFYRYLHPIIPLVYVFATATLVWIIQKTIDDQWGTVSKWSILRCFKKNMLIAGISSFLILIFVVGQTLGAIFLDTRFKADRTNKGKPPVYAKLSWELKENTDSDDVVITNLDTWGSWYGERKTVWFPLSPNQLIPFGEQESPFDAIYLTSYLMDDENYYMGDEWRQIFYNPEDPDNEFIAENYELKEVFEIAGEDVYEKQDARAVLFIKKKINGF
jgi:4-amino-4-deoxy-L-arabinose transferase-like glycosyltransferase